MHLSLNPVVCAVVVWLASSAVAAQTPVKPRTARPAPARAAAPAPAPVIPLPADDDQREAAKLTHLGHYTCELGQSLDVVTNPTYEAYVDVKWNKQVLVMKPVLSSTGALRLEDVTGRTLMIQIAHKSMLMDTKAGRRLVDECLHDVQRVAKDEASKRPPESSLGIDPARAAAVAAQPSAGAASPTPEPPVAAGGPAVAAGTAAAVAPAVAVAPAAPAAHSDPIAPVVPLAPIAPVAPIAPLPAVVAAPR